MPLFDPWTVVDSTTLLDVPRMKVVQEAVKLPDGRVVEDYYKIVMGRASVIAATDMSGQLVLLRMYKHGVGRSGVGFPGGGAEPGENDLEAAKRELVEETGYVSREWEDLGSYVVHSNQGCGNVSFFAAFGCEKVVEPVAEDLEMHEFLFATPAEVRAMLANREFLSMGHACMAALWLNSIAGRQS